MIKKIIIPLTLVVHCFGSISVVQAEANESHGNDLEKNIVKAKVVESDIQNGSAMSPPSIVVKEPSSLAVKSAEITATSLDKGATKHTPEVGKHVMANMDAGSMIMSLLMVLALIIISALLLKRFNLAPQRDSQLKVVSSLSLGTKEKVVVIQVGNEQLLLGMAGQQITLLDKLSEPINTQTNTPTVLPKNIMSFLSTKR